MGKLVNKQRRRYGYETIIFVRHPRTPDAIPTLGRDRMYGRTDCEKIKHHGFAVGIPAQAAESKFRCPLESECVSVIQRPRPLDAVIDQRSITANLRIV